MQPYINIVSNFDAKASYVFTYTFLGSERIITNELSIRESKDKSQPVYASQSTKFDKNHTVPEGTLRNGTTYLAKIRVQISESWSEWSPELEFTCLATPVITFESLDEKNFVYNDDIMMTALYRQEQGEKIKTYQFTLMNQNKVPITNYPTRFPDEKAPSILKERISGLVKGRLYYVGCRIITTNGINFFKTQEFIPHFVAPSLEGIVSVQNQSENGQILVQSYLKQMLGTQTKPFIPNAANDNPGNYTFLNNEWVVIPREMPLMYTRLGMAKASDWVAKVWCKNVLNGVMFDFSKEFGEGDHIQFVKHDDYIVCEKTHGTIKSRTKSNVIKGLGLKNFFLYIKVIEYRVQMKIVPMETVIVVNDFKNAVANSNFGIANKAFKSYQTQLINQMQGEELKQSEYNLIKKENRREYLSLSSVDLNGRPQLRLSFDMIGMLQVEFGDSVWGGKTLLSDKLTIANRVISSWKPYVDVYSTNPEKHDNSNVGWILIPNEYEIGNPRITGKFNGNVVRAQVKINGVEQPKGGTFSNGNFSYYVGFGKIAIGDSVTITAFGENDKVLELNRMVIVKTNSATFRYWKKDWIGEIVSVKDEFDVITTANTIMSKDTIDENGYVNLLLNTQVSNNAKKAELNVSYAKIEVQVDPRKF